MYSQDLSRKFCIDKLGIHCKCECSLLLCQELELVEEAVCVEVFPRFLRFLYSCHINLTLDNTLPILILADKYNVEDLRLVCINFACTYIIPKLQLKDVFHTWFQYATKGTCHQKLVVSSVKALSERMDDIMLSAEWDQEWVSLDKDQLIEILRSSDLMVKDEYELWKAVLKWLHSPSHHSRTVQQMALLTELMAHIRFPMMSPDQLTAIETSTLAQQFPELFQPYCLLAYKYHALPLTSRSAIREFYSASFLMRNYTDLRWDKRLAIASLSEVQKGTEVSLRFSTRASTFPAQTWEWELKVHPKGFSSTAEDFRVSLCSNLILDQPRPVEYWLSVVGRDRIIHTVSGKKNFSKTRYTMDTEMDKKISVSDLSCPNSALLVDDALIFQIVIKPVE